MMRKPPGAALARCAIATKTNIFPARQEIILVSRIPQSFSLFDLKTTPSRTKAVKMPMTNPFPIKGRKSTGKLLVIPTGKKETIVPKRRGIPMTSPVSASNPFSDFDTMTIPAPT